MATHSSILAWRIPGTAKPGGLLSTGSHRVGHDWSDLAAAAVAVKGMVFPVVVYRCELDHKEGWALKNLYFWIVVLKKTLESSLDRKKIKPINPKGNQPWILIGSTDAEVEAPILWPPDAKNWLIWKDPDAGKDWGQEEETTEDEMVGWHHQLNVREFEQAPGDWERQGSLAYCHSRGHKESDMTEWLNNNFPFLFGNHNFVFYVCGSISVL